MVSVDTVWSLPSCIMSCYLYAYDVRLPVQIMSCYLHYVLLRVFTVWSLSTCTKCLHDCNVWWLPIFISAQLFMYCLLSYLKSASPYDVCSALWCLSFMMSAYLYDVCSSVCSLYSALVPVWYLLNCMMFASLCINWIMAAYLYEVFSTEWCRPICMSLLNCVMSAKLYDVCLPV